MSGLEETLVEEAKLAAELLQAAAGVDQPDAEADRMGELVAARVTLIAADGRVLGDSSEPVEALPNLENHLSRPEVRGGRRQGHRTRRAAQHDARHRHVCTSRRASATRRSLSSAWPFRSPTPATRRRRFSSRR
jgi:hypothetical protein